MRGRRGSNGPSSVELKLRSDLERARLELKKLKSAGEKVDDAPKSDEGASAGDTATPDLERDALVAEVEELRAAKERLSRLYTGQLEENRRRAGKLHHVLTLIHEINADLDPEALAGRIAQTVQRGLGFRIVLVRLREKDDDRLAACGFAGLPEAARAALTAADVPLDVFRSWLRDEFRVGHSYYIGHKHPFNRVLPQGHVTDLGARESWEWHADDVLLVPLIDRHEELIGYLSVDDPEDRLVPARETLEMLESFASHAVVAIENARVCRELAHHTREVEEAGRRINEMNALKGNFVSTISRELRSPLDAIRTCVGTLDALAETETWSPGASRCLAILDAESERLGRLIESVLDLSRKDAGHLRSDREPVDVADVLDETVLVLRPSAASGHVNLKVLRAVADTGMDADRQQLRQLVLHLGGNAIKFTPAGGTVSLTLSGNDRDLTLEVEDTGIGIPEPALKTLFERFYVGGSGPARRVGGSGLGLAICKSIVDGHGGRIAVASAPAKGSRFTVTLPRRAELLVGDETRSLEDASSDVLQLAAEMVAEVMGARVVSLMSCEGADEMVIRAAVGLEPHVRKGTRLKRGQGVASRVAEHRRPVCVARPEDANEVSGSGRAQYRTGTFLSVPLEGRDRLLGVLNVTDPVSALPFDAEACRLLLDLAERVARAWEQSLATIGPARPAGETADALRQVVQHLRNHREITPLRIELAQALAREMGLNEAEKGIVRFAAAVHDVGMESMSEPVRAGADHLSAEERAELHRHAEMGAAVLEPIEAMGAVREIVLAHHEWWDGSGYPRGLSGEEIPVGARILAIADAYESMVTGRAYRAPMTRGAALSVIASLTGTQFDPRLVDTLERALAQVEANRPATEPALSDARGGE